MNRFTRVRLVPIISASISCDTLGSIVRVALRAIAREQQQRTRQPFLCGVEDLIDQILFDAHVPHQHVSDEAVGELVLFVQHAQHFVFLNDECGGGCYRCRGHHANDLALKAPFPKKITWTENSHNGFFAGLTDQRKFHAAFLNVHHLRGGITLREERFFSSKRSYFSSQPSRLEK